MRYKTFFIVLLLYWTLFITFELWRVKKYKDLVVLQKYFSTTNTRISKIHTSTKFITLFNFIHAVPRINMTSKWKLEVINSGIDSNHLLPTTQVVNTSSATKAEIVPFFCQLYSTNDSVIKACNIRKHPSFEDLMKTRINHLQNICKSQNIKHKLRASRIFWLKKQHIAYCPTYKSSSSTWFNYLMLLVNKPLSIKCEIQKKYDTLTEQVKHMGIIHPKASEWRTYASLATSKKHLNKNLAAFIVVRHPFERLVSAYRDKLEIYNNNEPFYYLRYGKFFVTKYRRQAIQALGEKPFHGKSNYGFPPITFSSNNSEITLPSFWEFVQAVIEKYKMDAHWEPIHKFCSVCNESFLKTFRYILKFEHLETEGSSFLKHCNWNYPLIPLNVNKKSEFPTSNLTHLYFSALSNEQIVKLYNFYELDFVLFNYSFPIEYLHFAKS